MRRRERRDVPITREVWRAAASGRLPRDIFDALMLEHHLAGCGTCAEEFAAYQAEPSSRPEPLRGHPARPDGDARIAHLLAALTELPAEARLERLRSVPPNSALVRRLLDESFASLPGNPRRSLEWSALAELPARRAGPSAKGELALARAHQGNALRALGRLQEAGRRFRDARQLLHGRTREGRRITDLSVYASVDWMEGAYLRERLEFEEAEQLLKRAKALFALKDDLAKALQVVLSLGQLHLIRGNPRDALDGISTVLPHLVEHEDPRTYWVARFNHAVYLAEAELFDGARKELAGCQAARPLGHDEFWLLHMRWLEGRIALGVGQPADAERPLREVRAGFIADGQAINGALASLDLARCLLQRGILGEPRQLRNEVEHILCSNGVERRRVSALLLAVERSRRSP